MSIPERNEIFSQFDPDGSGDISGDELDDFVKCLVIIYYNTKKLIVKKTLEHKFEYERQKAGETKIGEDPIVLNIDDSFVFSADDVERTKERCRLGLIHYMDFSNDGDLSHAEFVTSWNAFATEFFSELDLAVVTGHKKVHTHTDLVSAMEHVVR